MEACKGKKEEESQNKFGTKKILSRMW